LFYTEQEKEHFLQQEKEPSQVNEEYKLFHFTIERTLTKPTKLSRNMVDPRVTGMLAMQKLLGSMPKVFIQFLQTQNPLH
jgi:hypothetical protein